MDEEQSFLALSEVNKGWQGELYYCLLFRFKWTIHEIQSVQKQSQRKKYFFQKLVMHLRLADRVWIGEKNSQTWTFTLRYYRRGGCQSSQILVADQEERECIAKSGTEAVFLTSKFEYWPSSAW